MSCNSTKYVGREVALEFVIDCGDVMPAQDDWKLFGAGRTKSINPTWDTVDATADDTVGNIRTNLATWLAFEISADGVCRRSDSANSNQTELLKHFLNPVQTGGQLTFSGGTNQVAATAAVTLSGTASVFNGTGVNAAATTVTQTLASLTVSGGASVDTAPVLIGSLEYLPPMRVATLHLDSVDRQPVSILNELKTLLAEAVQVPGTKLD